MVGIENEALARRSDQDKSRECFRQRYRSISVNAATYENVRNGTKSCPFTLNNLRSTASEVYFDPRTEYIISPIDDADKFTQNLANCTCVVVVGTDKRTGRNISFLTHQSDPKMGETDLFRAELLERLAEIRERCIENDIDVVIAGGSFAHPAREWDYKATITGLDGIIKKVLGFEPYVAMGPKIDTHNDEMVYFDTENRTVYILRSTFCGKTVTAGYTPSDLGELAPVWTAERKAYRESISPGNVW